MSKNCLQPDQEKTEILLFGHTREKLPQDKPGSLLASVQASAKNVSVLLYLDLTLSEQLTGMIKSIFLLLRNISKLRLFLSQGDLVDYILV